MRAMMVVCLAAVIVPTAALAMEDLSITGYVDGEFQAVQDLDGSTPDPDDTTWNTSFGDQSDVLFWISGAPAEKVSFATEIDYTQVDNEIHLNQAVIDWALAGDKFGTRIGKFYFPFGIEARSRYSTTNKLATQPNAGPGYNMVGWADNGIGFQGKSSPESGMGWAWAAAVTNGFSGTPLGMSTTDDTNNNKSFGGRFELMPMQDQLNIGGSFAMGAWDPDGDNNYTRFGVHAIADFTPELDIRGEFLSQKLNDVTPGTDVSTTAFYVQGAWKKDLESMNYIEPVVRFGWMDPNTDADTDSVNQIALGLGFSPVEHFILKGEFDLNSEDSTVETDNNTFMFQGVYGW